MARFHSEGLDVHYDTFGADAAGTPIILVHGTGCRAEVLSRVAHVLAAERPVAALDLPGHGRSDGHGFRGAADYAHFVTALADHLGWARFVLLGHSLGGAIALVVAAYDPRRLTGLCLVDTGARLRVDPGPEIDPRWSFGTATTDETIDHVARDRGEVAPDVVYRDWVADDTFDVLARLKHIHVRSIAIGGSEDRLTPVRNHIAFRELMPDCDLAIIENSGHWPFYEQPEAFDAALAGFLATIDD